MSQEIEIKINQILEQPDALPAVFKGVLKQEMALTKVEDILDIVSLKREYAEGDKKSSVYNRAVLIVATSSDLMVIEEALNPLDLEYGGYRIRHILYSKITCLDFDSCLLTGRLRLDFSLQGANFEIEFDTSKHYFEFAHLAAVIRRKMVACEVGNC